MVDQVAALELTGLSKRFGSTLAVRDVSLRIEPGTFLGLVGPNGAGKTTTLGLATGLLRPDAGTSAVCGFDVWSSPEDAKARLGVLVDGDSLPQRLTGAELLTYLGLLRGMEKNVVVARVEEVLSVLDLGDAGATVVADYSTGMRKKVALAAALLHGPKLLVLDEPFEAVDPVSAATIRSILDEYIASGGTIVFSSHVMALVEQLCDQVAVMSGGQIRADGSVAEVRGEQTLDAAFAQLVGADHQPGRLSWFAS